MVETFRLARKKLGHVGEANRKLPGMGKGIPWTEIGQVLREIGYGGAVVMEPFLLEGRTVGRDVKVWRDLSGRADEIKMDAYMAEAVRFLKEKFL